MKKVLLTALACLLVFGWVEAKGPSIRPSSSPSRSSYSSSSVRPSSSSPKSYSSNSSGSNSIKPSGKSFDSAAASDKVRSESRVAYQKANNPQPTYTDKTGRSYNVDSSSRSTQHIRSVSYDDYSKRPQRIETHYYHYYGNRYNYYRSQPYIYVGGGYSSLFWYAMLDWSIDRQALWLYHNQGTIDAQLYAQRMQNAQLAAAVAGLQAQNLRRDSSYIDADFKNNPDLMYDNDYAAAAYNAQAINGDGNGFGWAVLGWTLAIIGGILLAWLIIHLIFIKEWN